MAGEDKREGLERLPAYVKVIIDYAEWVAPAYRDMVKNVKDINYLMEILACAYDRIPIEAVTEVVQKAKDDGNAREAIQSVRYQFLCNQHNDNQMYEKYADYEEQLTQINKKLDRLERKAGKLIKQLEADKADREKEETDASVSRMSEEKRADVPDSGTQGEEIKSPSGGRIIVIRDEGSGEKLQFWKRKKQSEYEKLINELLAEEETYSDEQINYLLDAVEAGVPAEDIRTFASPKLPVQVMARLRKMQEKRGGDRNGSGQRS